MDFLAITSPGIEGILQKELKELGIRTGKKISGGVEARGALEDVMKANLWSRTANRIVVRVDEFHASTFHELERRVKRVDWDRYVSKCATVAFRVTCRKSKLYHSDAVAERFENVLAQRLNVKIADRNADEESDSGAQLFVVRLADDVCTISVDSSGELLHRRGYRQAIAKAPLRETLAAAMLKGTGWNGSSVLVDPMCGSGTIAIEGALMARNIAPGINRKFAFQAWAEHDAGRWNEMRTKAEQEARDSVPCPIIASDRDAGAVRATIENAERAGVRADIEVEEKSISDVKFPEGPGWIVSNPPYGVRVGESASLRNLYSRIGAVVRQNAQGYKLALLSADRALEAQLKVRLVEAFRTTNGGIPVRLVTT